MQDLTLQPELLTGHFRQAHLAVLIALLLTAAIIDWRTYRVPNWLTVGGMVFGLLYNAFVPVPSWTALLWALAGLAVGLFALVPFYALRIMGAGDVKLMAMVGAIVALPDAVYAVLWSLIAGGLVALGYAIYRKAFGQLAGNLARIFHSFAFAAIGADLPSSPMTGRASVGRFPYGMSIAVGTIAWLVARHLASA